MGGAVALHSPPPTGHGGVATLICPVGIGRTSASVYLNGFVEASRGKKLEPVLQMLVANPALVTRDMIEDVLKYKRIDGVDAALKKMRDAIFPGGKLGPKLRDHLRQGESACPGHRRQPGPDYPGGRMPRAARQREGPLISPTPATCRTWRRRAT